jgi:uncharacterized protein YacL
MHITNLNTYFTYSIKIFLIAFIIGKSIDNIFITIQKRTSEYKINKIFYGIAQLVSLILISYYLHIFTNNQFSDELQIYSPSVLFSSFIFAIQTNMMKNLDILTVNEFYNNS